MRGAEQMRATVTKHFAVLGSPIEHSKSPAIHSAAFSFLKVHALYSRHELAEGLSEWVGTLDDSWHGLSLTMPLKEQALALADRADSLAIATGAANTLIRTETGWDAYNTDVFGIQKAVASVEAKSVSVIGSGATARSAIVAMQEMGKNVTLWARNKQAMKNLAAEFELAIHDKFFQAAASDLVISTLPAGALDSYLEELRTPPKGTLLDVAYHPWPSKAAERFGVAGQAISGLEMLLWQAVAQQRLFAGNDIDEPLDNEKGLVSAMRVALEMAK
jgi:shikimate dehydrogenase